MFVGLSMGGSDVTGFVATSTELCLELSEFSPSWVFLQILLFLFSTGLSVFNTITDWKVVLNFERVGFNNPLVPRSIHWLRAWYIFASLGTLLAVISIFHEGVDILHMVYHSYKKHCCKQRVKVSIKLENCELEEKLLEEDDEDEDEVINDPCKFCYKLGWNVTTRNETLGAIILWFQDVPMLTLAILYGLSQSSCKVPDTRDVTPILLDVGISAVAATLASFWRLLFSFVRLYSSVGSRIQKKGKCLKKCLPKEGDAAYPPGTCAQYCIFPFYFGLIMQMSGIFLAICANFLVWYNFAVLKTPNFDDSLGIYRYSLDNSGMHLFNISGNILPPNGTFVHFEEIPQRYFQHAGDIYCLSEFEYRSKDSKIFFNAIELVVVSENGQFCVTHTGPDVLHNNCVFYYTLDDILYYAFVDPVTGVIERFDEKCILAETDFNFPSGPTADFNIDVTRLVNRSESNESLVVLYPTQIRAYVDVQTILLAKDTSVFLYEFQDLETSANITCAIKFVYDIYYQQILFNYEDVDLDLVTRRCSTFSGSRCNQFHRNLTYGYISQDGQGIPYTQCSLVPGNKLVPIHDPTLIVNSPCKAIKKYALTGKLEDTLVLNEY